MKIAYFFSYKNSIDSWNKSGILERELEIFDKLNKKFGYTYYFLTYGDERDIELNTREYIEVIPLSKLLKRSDVNLLSSIIYPFKLKKNLFEFDLIQQNQISGSWVAIIFKLLTGKKLFVRTGYDAHLFSLHSQKNFIKVYLYKKITSLAIKFSDLYTVTSNCDLDHINKNYKNTVSKVKLRRNWVIVSENNYKKYENRILCVGRLESQKNYEKILKDFSNKDKEFVIDIVGDGTLKNYLYLLSSKLNVKINFLGKLNNQDLKELYKKYNYYISASLFEGNPKATLEAMGSGCIVYASKIPNHEEIITENKDGFLVDLNYESFYDKLTTSLKSSDNLSSIKANAINRVKENNNIDKLSEIINNDFKKLDNQNGK